MRRIVFFVILFFGLSATPPAYADQLVIDGFATFTYPSSVKLKKSGCQNIPFKYVTDENLPRVNTVMLVSITAVGSKRANGYAVWFSTQTSREESSLAPMARIGVLQVKVCREEFKSSPKDKNKRPGTNKGTYTLHFGAGNTDPITGTVLGDKIEIKRKIKFI